MPGAAFAVSVKWWLGVSGALSWVPVSFVTLFMGADGVGADLPWVSFVSPVRLVQELLGSLVPAFSLRATLLRMSLV